VGNGIDFSAGVTGVINGVTGSFPIVSGVTSEMGSNGIPNSYSLQLNAKPFATPVCGAQPLCQGWEQFIYSSQGFIFIQFWLEYYNTTCPHEPRRFLMTPPPQRKPRNATEHARTFA